MNNKILNILIFLAACGPEARETTPDSLVPDVAIPENNAATCKDGIDNDGDGATDCDDSNCWEVNFGSAGDPVYCESSVTSLRRGRYPVGSGVNISDIVVTAVGNQANEIYFLWVADRYHATGPYNGVMIYDPKNITSSTGEILSPADLQPGDPLDFIKNDIYIDGISEFSGMELTNNNKGISIRKGIGVPIAIKPYDVMVVALASNKNNLDGVLIRINDITVLNPTGYGIKTISDISGSARYLPVDLLGNDLPTSTCYRSITGVAVPVTNHGTDDGYAIRPRTLSDIVSC